MSWRWEPIHEATEPLTGPQHMLDALELVRTDSGAAEVTSIARTPSGELAYALVVARVPRTKKVVATVTMKLTGAGWVAGMYLRC